MVRVGLVGAGFMGGMHANCYAQIPNAELVAVGDVTPGKAKELAKQHGAKAYTTAAGVMRQEIDIVDICLPTYMHAQYTCRAARKGLNVVCEKPMALKMRDANRMVRTVKETGVKFMVAHVIRFWPEYQVLKEYVDNGSLGKLLVLSLVRVSPRPTWAWENWLQNAELSGAALVDLHVHDADFVRYLCGEPERVETVGTKKEGGWDYVFTSYHYPDKAVSAEGGWNLPPEYPFQMAYRAVFEEGTLEFSTSHSPTISLYPQDGGVQHPALPEQPAATGDAGGNISELGGYYNELKYFVDCVERGEHPTIVTPDDALASLALVHQELKSAEKKLSR